MRRHKGIIVSAAMRNTVVVRVDRLKEHSAYHKHYRVSRTFKAHDAEQQYRSGDVVVTRPRSREKRWKVARLVKRAQDVSEEINGAADQENQESGIKNQ